MNIIIVGCGKVGASLVERLSAEGHDLVVVDIAARKVEELSNKYDIMGIVGNGASIKRNRMDTTKIATSTSVGLTFILKKTSRPDGIFRIFSVLDFIAFPQFFSILS